MTKQQPAPPVKKAASRKPPKKIIALQYLMARSLIQLEALSLYGETCLHSTISELSNTHGLTIERQPEPHIHQDGGTAYFTRYTLAESSRADADNLVKHYLAKVAA
ncbi:Helix-turn-helix domain-containing protein [Oceanospirillum multiglobuliferum]|uniref:Uncharacterized protein n=1 Tax=Oceanospirillum multiglobuliferum TaxID=64969 RepID=A0A1T4QCC1_9GAMM|nr:hypothetical protein [Oceanospirillum multiglobuliferum]OPX56521.1 hypothetical protein BTE48_03600 [Oceanospirillum multiglobuliferum]SKA01324.1 Helix-turn-helix domain-containing protein [Oceanospirillum multiglobuliferum]